MAARKIADQADLHSYYRERVESLTKGLSDIAESLFSEKSISERRDFEERVAKRLNDGAKFVPRKRQPR